jgi:dCMP deaminase
MEHQQQPRISWNEYFMSVAELVSRRSSCKKLNVGCVLVKDKRIISTGYNGHLPGQPHVSMIVDNHELATVHAEQNAICDCSSRGISTKDAIAYITHLPCIYCFKILVASGIKHIIYKEEYKKWDWKKLIREDSIKIEQYKAPVNIIYKNEPEDWK